MKKEEKKYMPINCSLYDQLLEKATLKQKVEIAYWNNKQEEIISSKIEDVYTTAEGEFMKLSTQQIIRLDQIIRLNDQAFDADSCQVPPPKSNKS